MARLPQAAGVAEPLVAGTPTLNDSYWLSQSAKFKLRVTAGLTIACESINLEVPTGVTGTLPNAVHAARKNFASNVLNPGQFSTWVTQFVTAVSGDTSSGGVIQQATQSATNYTPITDATVADTAQANVTDTVLNSAIAAVFNMFISGI